MVHPDEVTSSSNLRRRVAVWGWMAVYVAAFVAAVIVAGAILDFMAGGPLTDVYR